MQKFSDRTGREWLVDVTVATIQDARKTLGVDLIDAAGEVLARLQSDPVLLVDVLYVVCRDQAGAEGVSDDAFGRLMAGDVIDEATTALLEAMLNFFPKLRRPAIRAAWNRYQELETSATNQIMSRMADKSIDQAVTRRVDQHLDAALELIGIPSNTPTG